MEFKIKIFYSILIISLSFLLTSCKWQEKPQQIKDHLNKHNPSISIGQAATEMDGNRMIIFQDKQNNFWFGGEGLYKYDGKELSYFTVKDGLCHNRIRSIQEDQFGNIYFNTGAGISKFDGQKFTTLITINGETSDKAWKLAPNDLWFEGNWVENGPYRYDGKNLYHLKLPKHELEKKFYATFPNVSFSPYEIYTIYKDQTGSIWFGTGNFGVCRFDGKNLAWISEEELVALDDGPAPGIRSIIEDKNGKFWFSND